MTPSPQELEIRTYPPFTHYKEEKLRMGGEIIGLSIKISESAKYLFTYQEHQNNWLDEMTYVSKCIVVEWLFPDKQKSIRDEN